MVSHVGNPGAGDAGASGIVRASELNGLEDNRPLLQEQEDNYKHDYLSLQDIQDVCMVLHFHSLLFSFMITFLVRQKKSLHQIQSVIRIES